MKYVWFVALLAVALFGVSIAIDPPAAFDVWVLRKQGVLFTGVAAFALMSLIMVLAVRPVWLERSFGGLDRMYRAHKWAGIGAIVLGLLHYFIELSGGLLASLFGKPVKGPRPEFILDVFRGAAKDFGEWSVWLLGGMLVITLWQRFPYSVWRYVHKVLAVIYLLLAFHAVVLAPPAYWMQPVGWMMAACALAGSVCAVMSLAGRIGRQRTHRGVIASVSRLGDDMLEIVCKLDAGWRHKAGQFAFLTCDRLEGAHPFTISSADHGNGELRFSIKTLGDYTRRMQDTLRAGDQVSVEGPYGCFDFRGSGGRQVWIGGGIGITPFLAWLESLQASPSDCPNVELHYCVRNRADAVHAERLRRLCATLPSIALHIHCSDEEGYLNAQRIRLGEGAAPDVWFCGPQAMGDTLRRGLAQRGVPARNFHQEAFQMR